MKAIALFLGLLFVLPPARADDGQFVRIGERQLFVRCSGMPSGATVILVNGLGAGLDVWNKVQAEIEKFTRVCSYDRAGEGRSDKISHLQTPDEVDDDLSRLLAAEKLVT